MASISRSAATAGSGLPRKTYIAMRNYQGDIFSYATSNVNFVTMGSLSAVPTAASSNCLKGNFLVETGSRLYPDVHPGVSTMMVSVMDYNALSNGVTVKGFIDPNSFAFSPTTTDRAYFVAPNGNNPNPEDANGSNWPANQGPPVYTHGDIIADGNTYIGGHMSTMKNVMFAGNQSTIGNVTVGGNTLIMGNQSTIGNVTIGGNQSTIGSGTFGNTVVVTSGQIRATTVAQSTFGSGASMVIDPAIGQVFNFDMTSAAPASMGISVGSFPPGAQLFFILNNNSGSNRTYDFNSGFRSFNSGQNTVGAGNLASASFICDGVNFIQVGGGNPLTQ